MSSPQPNIPLELRPDHPEPAHPSGKTLRWELAVGIGVLLIGVGIGIGAIDIPSEAGYGGVGSNFLPWVIALALVACGGVLTWEALTGGFRSMEESPGDEHPYWMGFVWVSAGLLLNAALLEHIGFVVSCALTYLLAVQGLKRAYGKPHNTWLTDFLVGMAIAAPVYWLFVQFLAINLPGLTSTGWI
ncbi:MAG: tripartite tricarboxylate transporter TctB family protein [Pseudomonadota bacterium]|nr:tripartite tricarboxylate transporter TctB family protein [Pseudomonadota bacterium]